MADSPDGNRTLKIYVRVWIKAKQIIMYDATHVKKKNYGFENFFGRNSDRYRTTPGDIWVDNLSLNNNTQSSTYSSCNHQTCLHCL